MTYSVYTAENIFAEPRLNAICDYLFLKLMSDIPPKPGDIGFDYILRGLILSGKAAEILQGGSGEISNVTFQTDKEDLYVYLMKNSGLIFKCPQIKFKNRILLYPFPDLYLEIWWSSNPLVPADVGRIKVQEVASIPFQTL